MFNYFKFYGMTQRSGILNLSNSFGDKLLAKYSYKTEVIDKLLIPVTLELGCTQGQHLKYVDLTKHKQYIGLDIEINTKNNLETLNTLLSTHSNLNFIGGDVCHLPFKANSVSEIISLCLFHHVSNPEKAILNCLRVLKPGGKLIIQLPTDPGILNHLIKKFFIFPILRKKMVEPPEFYYAKSHQNHIWSLIQIFKYNLKDFGKLYLHYWPFVFKSWNLNLIVILEFQKAQLEHL